MSDFFRDFLDDGRNEHIRWFDGRHGSYAGVTVTPQTWTTDYHQVTDLRLPDSSVETIKTVTTEAGDPGVQL